MPRAYAILSSAASLATRHFSYYLMNSTIFGGKVIEHKNVFRSSLQHLFETFIILRRIQRVIVINLETSMQSIRHFSGILIKLEIC